MTERHARRGGSLERRSGNKGPLREYLAFKLAEEVYAADIAVIGEILRIPPITIVPRAPQLVMGIVGVRGRVLSVLDVRRKLRLPELPASRHARILVLPLPDGDMVGLYVDEVLQVYRFSDQEIEQPSNALGNNFGEHVMGVGRRDTDLVVLVQLDALLGFQERRS